MNDFPHFVFGYGSLICSKSRAITAPTVADRKTIPVTVKGVERTWAKKSVRGYTSMGVRFQEGAECVGVLVPVNNKELEQFDEREIGYDRYELRAEDISPLKFLDEARYENTFLTNCHMKPPHVWVYVQKIMIPANPDFPIVQSYLDIILRGCLSISEEFTHEFMKSTKGWHPSELLDESDNSCSNDSMFDDSENSRDDDDEVNDFHWINDRKDPIYVRADMEYSLNKAQEIDFILDRYLSQEFQNRIKKGKSQRRIRELRHSIMIQSAISTMSSITQ